MTTRQTSPVEPTPPAPGHPAAGTLRPAAAPSPAVARGGEGAQPRVIVIGLDLSLSSTGIATSSGPATIRTTPEKNLLGQRERLNNIVNQIDEAATDENLTDPWTTLVVLEGPSYASSGAGTWDRAGLWWLTVDRLLANGTHVAVVPPAVLKRYAAGKGNATKPDMRMALYQRAALDLRDDNQVDAVWLRLMGLDFLGHPAIDMPKAQRSALDKATWPEAIA